MKNVTLMAVDLGTTFIKAAVYDSDGTRRSVAKAAVNSDSSRPGIFIQSGGEIYESVLSAMKKAAELAGEYSSRVAAIGFTGQMAGFIGVDRSWNDITSWSCSLTPGIALDGRADEDAVGAVSQYLRTNAPLMSAKCKWFVSDYPEEAKKGPNTCS
jgi:sugar (pentulose or hexulose) kinase